MTGRMLRHYRVDQKIGEGGMGVVYKGWDTHLDRPVAIKVLSAEAVSNPDRKRRFIQEAKSASALNHPNIITVYDVDSLDGVDFIVMEFVDGDTLDRHIGRSGLKFNVALRYAAQIADALTRAHGSNIVHRDLKPANVMVDRHGLVKVLDFGLAKLTEPRVPTPQESTLTDAGQTAEGTVIGTAAYMSPEQAEGKPVDARSDVFSFGTLLYEALTGTKPFQGETRMSTISAILTRAPDPVSAKAAGLPAEIERIVMRCLRKDPARRFQHMDEVKLALDELREQSDSGQLSTSVPAAAPAPKNRWRWAAMAAGLAAISGAAWVLLLRSTEPAPAAPLVFTRVTADSGLTTDPALSPDGKLLAYASDRATGEDLDIWVQHLGSGDPVRLTNWPSSESEPDFSPDAGRIAFRSTRDGGGIYVVPVLGGEPRMVVRNGFRPRFSPDGNSIAYWTGAAGSASGTTDRQVFVVPATGGAPKRVGERVADIGHPVWMKDGKHLLVAGGPFPGRDWWVVPVDGGEAQSTGVLAELGRTKVSGDPWSLSDSGDSVLFSSGGGQGLGRYGATNLWKIRLGSDGKAAGPPERITSGTAIEGKPATAAGGVVAMSSGAFSANLWLLPMDTDRGVVTGEMTQVTTGSAVNERPGISRDGKRLVFVSNRTGNGEIWFRDIESGKERALTSTPEFEYWPSISSDGNRVYYSDRSSNKASMYFQDLAAEGPNPAGKLGTAWSISPDGRYGLRGGGSDGKLVSVKLPTLGEQTVASHPSMQLLSPRFSHDGKWIAMHVRNTEFTRQIWAFPFYPDRETKQSEWVPITGGTQLDRDPEWSSDGKTIYFLADRDGFRGIYGQRVDGAAKRPIGPQFEVKMFRSTRRSMMNFFNTGATSPAVASDKMIFALGELSANIWIAKIR